MQRCRIALVSLFLWLTFSGSPYAAGLDAKPGLWERSVTTRTDLLPTAKHDLSKLPLAERAKLDEMMSGQITTGRRTRVSKECVTATMLERWSTVTRDASGAKCERKVEVENSKHFKVALSCDGGKTTGDIEFTASGERFDGSVALKSREPEFDRIVTQQISSKWLGSDCGGVAPAQPS